MIEKLGGLVQNMLGGTSRQVSDNDIRGREPVTYAISIVCYCLLGVAFLVLTTEPTNGDPSTRNSRAKLSTAIYVFAAALLVSSAVQNFVRFRGPNAYHVVVLMLSALTMVSCFVQLNRDYTRVDTTRFSWPFFVQLLCIAAVLAATVCNDNLSIVSARPVNAPVQRPI